MCIEEGGWANLAGEGRKGEGEPCTRDNFARGNDGAAKFRSQGGQVQLPHRRAFFFGRFLGGVSCSPHARTRASLFLG